MDKKLPLVHLSDSLDQYTPNFSVPFRSLFRSTCQIRWTTTDTPFFVSNVLAVEEIVVPS